MPDDPPKPPQPAMTTTKRQRRLIACAAMWLLVTGLYWQATTTPTICVRPLTLRQRVEWALEDWGLLPPDPFRYVVG